MLRIISTGGVGPAATARRGWGVIRRSAAPSLDGVDRATSPRRSVAHGR